MGVVNPVVHNKRPSSFAKLDDCSPETDLHCGCKLPYRIPKEHYEMIEYCAVSLQQLSFFSFEFIFHCHLDILKTYNWSLLCG